MEAAFRTRLVTGLTGLVGERVYWGIRPQNSALPAVVLTVVADARTQHMAGFNGYRATRVQVDCYAASYGDAVALREAVIATAVPQDLTGATKFLRTFVNGIVGRGEDLPTTYVHRQMIDLTVWHD